VGPLLLPKKAVEYLVSSFTKLLFSSSLLVLANLIPLYGVMSLGWSVFSILILYWFENVIIGVFTFLKIWKAEGSDAGEKVFFLGFFPMHYGIFTLVHGIFLIAFFIGAAISWTGVVFGIFTLIISHGLSFLGNYIPDVSSVSAHHRDAHYDYFGSHVHSEWRQHGGDGDHDFLENGVRFGLSLGRTLGEKIGSLDLIFAWKLLYYRTLGMSRFDRSCSLTSADLH
jgi:hypothetical protein